MYLRHLWPKKIKIYFEFKFKEPISKIDLVNEEPAVAKKQQTNNFNLNISRNNEADKFHKDQPNVKDLDDYVLIFNKSAKPENNRTSNMIQIPQSKLFQIEIGWIKNLENLLTLNHIVNDLHNLHIVYTHCMYKSIKKIKPKSN